ncbi:uncharacterized protein LOC133290990 [Gastrolobium bilobum]|uniref:uncharacterized protein LOC133290990 n=1 Tax=Gastrolobium bilobum TaxID=150636 RepID=UPI002AB2A59C|nr:uncharacterized protein LOC133290990 [Gastrolobium bilobum]
MKALAIWSKLYKASYHLMKIASSFRRGRGNHGGYRGSYSSRGRFNVRDSRGGRGQSNRGLDDDAVAYGRGQAPKVAERSHYTANEEKTDEPAMLSTYKGGEDSGKDVWYLDTGASNHMSGNKELFTELNENVQGEVTFGDLSKGPVKDKGKIMNFTKNGDRKYIYDVFYIPSLKSNLLSLGQLLEKGYNIHLKNNSLIIRTQKGEFIVKVNMTRNRLFKLSIQTYAIKCMKTITKDSSWLCILGSVILIHWSEAVIKNKDGEWISINKPSRSVM